MHDADRRGASDRITFSGSRLPQLDGIRALAVTAVLVHHTGALTGGFLGVDLFFVLSGFLITTLLCEEIDRKGGVSLRGFWFRRAFRLLPALLVYLLAGVAASLALKGPADQRQYDLDATLALFGVNNWWRGFGGEESAGAWDGHLWSLSVEAQFYLLWPLVLTAVLLQLRRRARWVALGSTIAAIAVWRAVLMTGFLAFANPGDRTYFATDTRADALLIGAALSLLWQEGHLTRLSARFWGWASAAAWAVLLAAMVLSPTPEHQKWGSYGGFTLVALLAALIVAAAVVAPDTGIARVFALRPLVWLGGISYALYLWHFPITVQLETMFGARFGELAVSAMALAVSAGVAWGSAVLIERPLGRWRRVLEKRLAHTRLLSVSSLPVSR